MIPQRSIIEAIDAADVQFSWCWEQLQKLRRHNVELQNLVDFQVRLTEAFTKLDQAYRAVKSEQKNLINRKHRYNKDWFATRMAILDRYLNAIKEALGIGRTLGGGFAWILYRNEAVLLEVHAQQSPQLLLPPKVGGIGERAFVQKLQGLGGMFVLYHAITSFLRLGDVSFFDPASGSIASIGELKTRHAGGDRYNITLGVVFDKRDNLFAGQAKKKPRIPSEPLGTAIQQKFDQQVRQITAALHKRVDGLNDQKLRSQATFHYDVLERVVRRSRSKKFDFGKAGASLVVGAWRPYRLESLGRRLLRTTGDLEGVLSTAPQAAMQIMDPGLSDNCLFVGTLASHESGFPEMLFGGVPFIWWPLEEKALHDLIFGHVIVTTYFNPAHLWALLRKRGFNIETAERSRVISVSRKTDGKRIEVHNFGYFERLIPYGLMDESAVIHMIEVSMEKTMLVAGGRPAKVNIRPRIV